MEIQSLSPVALWVLIVLAGRPGHAYEVHSRIVTTTLFAFNPQRSTVYAVIARFEREGMITKAWTERSYRSPYKRTIYELTKLGWTTLRTERRRLTFATQAIDRQLALQRALQANL